MQRYAHLFIIPPIFFLDRWTKLLVADDLPFGGSTPVFSWLSIVYWRNTGGLFGLMSKSWVGHYIFLFTPFVIVAGLACSLLFYRPSFWSRLSLTFVLSGALGNMYDRVLHGYVVDFIDVSYGTLHWPAFNVADMSITFGMGLWLYAQLSLKEGYRRG